MATFESMVEALKEGSARPDQMQAARAAAVPKNAEGAQQRFTRGNVVKGGSRLR